MTALLRAAPRRPTVHAPALAAGVAAVAIGAAYPVTAAVVHPLLLPAAVVGAAVFALALRRPGVMVGMAIALASLSPGLIGASAWVPGALWILMAFGLVVSGRGAKAEGSAHPALSVAVTAYVATVVAAFAIAPDATAALPVLRSHLFGALLFFVAAWSLRAWRDVATALTGVSVAIVLVGGLATVQHLTGAATDIGFITSTGELVTRATGGLGHPNQLGGFLVLLLPFSVAAAVGDRPRRLLHLAAVGLAVAGVYASFSRGALLGMLAMPFLALRWRTVLLVAPPVVVVLLVSAPALVQDRFSGGDSENVAGRTDIWTAATAIWQERPLAGAGLASFPAAYAEVALPGKQFLPDTRFVPPPHAHNLLLQLLSEQGLIGATAFAAVAGGVLVTARRLRSSPIRRHAVVGTAALASFVGLAVQGVFDVTLLENAATVFWGMLGIISALAFVDTGERAADVG